MSLVAPNEIRAIRSPSKGKFAVVIGHLGEYDCEYPDHIKGDEDQEILYINSILDQLVAQQVEKNNGSCV
jgi:hypothetical protein